MGSLCFNQVLYKIRNIICCFCKKLHGKLPKNITESCKKVLIGASLNVCTKAAQIFVRLLWAAHIFVRSQGCTYFIFVWYIYSKSSDFLPNFIIPVLYRWVCDILSHKVWLWLIKTCGLRLQATMAASDHKQALIWLRNVVGLSLVNQ